MSKEGSKRIAVFLLLFAILVVFLLLIYFIVYKDIFLIFTAECTNSDCFNKHLAECRRARWVSEAEEATWIYTIKDRAEGSCEVAVELAVVKEGKIDLRAIEGEEMMCYLPLNAVSVPGKDLTRCTGKLKEGMQDLIIKKMHSYILENLGQINEELTKAV